MVKKEVEENQTEDKQEEEVDDDSGEEELEYDEEEQEEVEIKASSVKLFMMCKKIMLLSFHKIITGWLTGHFNSDRKMTIWCPTLMTTKMDLWMMMIWMKGLSTDTSKTE